jgi:CRISPR/Cas system-associated protein Csm6
MPSQARIGKLTLMGEGYRKHPLLSYPEMNAFVIVSPMVREQPRLLEQLKHSRRRRMDFLQHAGEHRSKRVPTSGAKVECDAKAESIVSVLLETDIRRGRGCNGIRETIRAQ